MQIILKTTIGRLFLLSFLALVTSFVSAGSFGLDSFEVYLNNRLLFRTAVDKSFSLQNLNLGEANANDQLTIKYHECKSPASGPRGRTISMRDDSGNIIKEWKFADGAPNNSAMTISVQEILQAQKKGGTSLVLYYSSDDLGSAQKLAAL